MVTLERISIYIFLYFYMSSGNDGPQGPPRCVQTLSRLDHIRLLGKAGKDRVSWTFLPVALASVLRLRIQTTPVPYLVNAQRAATVRANVKAARLGHESAKVDLDTVFTVVSLPHAKKPEGKVHGTFRNKR